MTPYTLIALERANERVREIERSHYRHDFEPLHGAARPARRSLIRRPMAHLFAAVSRSSAAAARRLDGHVATDLERAFAPTE